MPSDVQTIINAVCDPGISDEEKARLAKQQDMMMNLLSLLAEKEKTVAETEKTVAEKEKMEAEANLRALELKQLQLRQHDATEGKAFNFYFYFASQTKIIDNRGAC